MEIIIVATDFSESANNATEYAIELARYLSARLVLVNAYPFPIIDASNVAISELLPVLEKEAYENLEAIKKSIQINDNKKLQVECFAALGSLTEVVKTASQNYKADLVVVGITGKAGLLKKHLIGSNAIDLARELNLYTFIIPENTKYKRIHKISYACDLQKTEESALIYIAKYFCRLFDAKLEIVNVETSELINTEKNKTLSFIEDKLICIEHENKFIKGQIPGKALNEYFHSHESDVIMVNPKKHDLLDKMINPSVTKELVFNSQLPLLIIH